MLYKNEILKILKKLPFEKNKYWVGYGSALVLYGIKENTHDIDICCLSDYYNYYISQTNYKSSAGLDGDRIVTIPFLYDNTLGFEYSIDLIETKIIPNIVYIEGIPVSSLEDIRKRKVYLGREKDKKDVLLIDSYLKVGNYNDI